MTPINLSAARRALDELKSWDLHVVSVDGVKSLLTPALSGLRIEAPRFKAGLRLFRSRAMSRPLTREDLWCPPFGVTKLGRVNREKDVLFYSTAMRDSAVFEIQPGVGDTIGLGIWETTADLRIAHFGYLPAVFGKLGATRKAPPWARHPATPDADPANLELGELIEASFTQHVPGGQEHLYKVSVAVAEVFLLDEPSIDAIAYPTLRMFGNTDNIAIKPQVAERVLRFAGAEVLRVEGLLNPGYSMALLDRADCLRSDGTIEWGTV